MLIYKKRDFVFELLFCIGNLLGFESVDNSGLKLELELFDYSFIIIQKIQGPDIYSIQND